MSEVRVSRAGGLLEGGGRGETMVFPRIISTL